MTRCSWFHIYISFATIYGSSLIHRFYQEGSSLWNNVDSIRQLHDYNAAVPMLLLPTTAPVVNLKFQHELTGAVTSRTASPPGATEVAKSNTPTTITMTLQANTAAAAAIQHNSTAALKWRKFVSYTSSPWEQLWLQNVDLWAKKRSICKVLHSPEQSQYMHDFLNLTCSARYEAPYDHWCIIDDAFHPMWYNTANRESYELTWYRPFSETVQLQHPIQAIVPGPQHENVVSKFVFEDERTGEQYTEYIEPLVSHLRFPLCRCTTIQLDPNSTLKYRDFLFRGWVIPPPPPSKGVRREERAFYFDAGASEWNGGLGGPSLSYFHAIWERSGIRFDETHAFEAVKKPRKFLKTVPRGLRDRVFYKRCFVSSSAANETDDSPFIPNLILNKTNENDYVMFKLDIDSPGVENGSIEFLLAHPNPKVDELFWEHHVVGNYIMRPNWGPPELQDRKTLGQSYNIFLRLRQKGIRAHSWV